MIEHQLATILATTLSLFGLLAFFQWPYRQYRIDRFRDEIFDIRGELFQLGMNGGVSFDHPAYGIFRQTLNGFIRFGDHLGLASFIALTLQEPGSRRQETARQFQERWEQAVASLGPEARTKVSHLRQRMHLAVLILVVSTPILICLIVPTLICVLATVLGSWFWQTVTVRLAPLFARVDSAALKVGEA